MGLTLVLTAGRATIRVATGARICIVKISTGRQKWRDKRPAVLSANWQSGPSVGSVGSGHEYLLIFSFKAVSPLALSTYGRFGFAIKVRQNSVRRFPRASLCSLSASRTDWRTNSIRRSNKITWPSERGISHSDCFVPLSGARSFIEHASFIFEIK